MMTTNIRRIEKLCKQFEGGIPGTSGEAETAEGNADTRDTVFVLRKNQDTVAFEGIKDTCFSIIITTEEITARFGEGDRGKANVDVVLASKVLNLIARANIP